METGIRHTPSADNRTQLENGRQMWQLYATKLALKLASMGTACIFVFRLALRTQATSTMWPGRRICSFHASTMNVP